MKKKKDLIIDQSEKETGIKTTVVSWGAFYNDPCYYQFPPGLRGVKDICSMRGNVLFLMNDGTITGWYGSGVGGRSEFHKHISTLKNVVKIKWRNWGFRQDGIYVWYSNGECELLQAKKGESFFKGGIDVFKLGSNVIDVITGSEDIAVNSNGELTLIDTGSNDEDVIHIRNLLDKINSEPSKRLSDYTVGYLFTGGGSNTGATILWQDINGGIHFEQEGKPSHSDYRIEGTFALPKDIDPVDNIVPCDNGDYGINFVILRKGKLTALDLFNSVETEIHESAALKSLKSPISKIKCLYGSEGHADAVMAFSETGRALLVTTHELTSLRPNRRDRFKKKSISPAGFNVLDATVIESGFIAIVEEASKELQPIVEIQTVKHTSRELFVWGKGPSGQSVDVARKPEGIGNVIDVAVYVSGWVCVMEDGSLFGLDSFIPNGDIIPPWYPSDFISVEFENGIKAKRSNGEIWVWGLNQFIRGARSVNLQELQEGKGNSAYDHLVPPDGLKDCYKVFKADDLVVALSK